MSNITYIEAENFTLEDRFGKQVKPREWFLVPLHIINDVVQNFVDGTVTGLVYDPQSASLCKVNSCSVEQHG